MSRPLLALTLLLFSVFVTRTASAAPSELEQAAQAYAKGEYKRAISLLTPLLYPTIRLPSEDMVKRAHKMLGISYVFEKDEASAGKEFLAILSSQPDYRLDPLVEPESAVKLFDKVRAENAEKLQKIKAGLEAERKRREAELKRKNAQPKLQLVIERETITRSFWANFVPFGVGQFQNGHRVKGWILFSAQIGLGVASLSSAIVYRVTFANQSIVPAEDVSSARALSAVQVITGAAFFAAVAYGIVDALLYYEPAKKREKRYQRKLTLSPTFAPERAGLSLNLSF